MSKTIEELRKAARIGRKLIGLRLSSGFEIIARAEWGLGNREKALRVLEERVRAAPGSGQLWDLLGCFLSEVERYEEAHAAFARALQSPHVEAGQVPEM